MNAAPVTVAEMHALVQTLVAQAELDRQMHAEQKADAWWAGYGYGYGYELGLLHGRDR